MTKENIAKLLDFDQNGDPELEEAIENAQSIDEVIELFANKGIEVTKEDLVPNTDELSEEDLEMVSGGGALFWPNIGFFNGFASGLNDDPRNPKWENKGGPLFRVGYKCGRIIGGTYFKW